MNYWVEQPAKDYERRVGIKMFISACGQYAKKTSPMGPDRTYKLNKCSNQGGSNGKQKSSR